MVNYQNEYKVLLKQGEQAFDDLLQLYLPDKQAEQDWADISAADTRTKRNSLRERLQAPIQLSKAEISTLIVSIGHYLDSHWADYQEDFPTVNLQKHQQIKQIHATLAAIAHELGQIYNALFTS